MVQQNVDIEDVLTRAMMAFILITAFLLIIVLSYGIAGFTGVAALCAISVVSLAIGYYTAK